MLPVQAAEEDPSPDTDQHPHLCVTDRDGDGCPENRQAGHGDTRQHMGLQIIVDEKLSRETKEEEPISDCIDAVAAAAAARIFRAHCRWLALHQHGQQPGSRARARE